VVDGNEQGNLERFGVIVPAGRACEGNVRVLWQRECGVGNLSTNGCADVASASPYVPEHQLGVGRHVMRIDRKG
jgi:hypothetical protein